MLKSKFIVNLIFFFLLFTCCKSNNSFAHEGHDHFQDTSPVTIERSTYTHFQSILSIYQKTYLSIIKGKLHIVPVLANILLDTAEKGIQTESKESGRHLMQHIQQGAQRLRQAEKLPEMQEALASISEAFLPFFQSWPNQLKRNEVKFYQCKEHDRYWLQHQDLLPVCPYSSDKLYNCSDISEVVDK